MPWTWEDASKFKEGLSEKKAKQWARIANAAYTKCIKAGGTDETCAPKAIKQANGVVNANSAYTEYKEKQVGTYEAELTVHQGRAHYKIPVVMMVEGVHSGSRGALYHSIDELGKVPASWDGIPIVIDHPESAEGVPISANQPEVIDAHIVGRVYHTNVDGNKLKAEAWLDEERLNEISPAILTDIVDNKILEVSVGVFTDEIEEQGEWNGEEYTAVAVNHRPDHLAILSVHVGACSCEDGCGLGANQSIKDMEQKGIALSEMFDKVGLRVSPFTINKETSYRERMDAAYAAIRGLETNDTYYYVEDLFDTYIVYSVSDSSGTKMYKQDYLYESGKIVLIDSAVEVHREVSYVTNSLSINKKEVNMSKECTPCVKEKVDALIANSQGRWTEDDRGFLETLSEAQLDKLEPIEVEKVVEKEIEVNKLTPQQEADLAFVANMRAENKRKMISEIQANTSIELWPDAVLNDMDDATLKRVHESVRKKDEVTDYSLSGVAPATFSETAEVMLPVGFELDKE